MIHNTRRKLIEVALPLDAINKASIREKSIRHGHPSTLHLWWARRPLAACRAVLFAQLVDDPSSHPEIFTTPEAVDAERERLFKIIEDIVKWENSTNEDVLQQAREEIARSCNDQLPPVYDPFSGGGSIPLEAQRLGLPAYGSDLNPIAVVIGKAMVEIPPRFKNLKPVHSGGCDRVHYQGAEGLAEDVQHYGNWMREFAFKRIGHLYPKVELSKENGGGEATIIAWIWARTVPSPDPAFSDFQVPLVSSFILSSKAGKEVWVEPIVNKAEKTINYRINKGASKDEIEVARSGTKSGRGANFRCLLSGSAIPPDHVRASCKAGRIGQTLIAIVAEGKNGRIYIEPSVTHEKVAFSAFPEWKPDQTMNQDSKDLVSGRGYGFKYWYQLFTNRQLVALKTFSDLVHEARSVIERDALAAGMSDDLTPLRSRGVGARAYADAVSVYLGFTVDKCSDYWSAVCGWHTSGQKMRNTFGRQAIPMVWDFAEANPFSMSTGSWTAMCDWVWKVLNNLLVSNDGQVQQNDAQTIKISQDAVISTDPPYYDNIGYADLSDFFYCWLKPVLCSVFPDLFSMIATPKQEELVATSYRHGGKNAAEWFFLDGMSKAIKNMVLQSSNDYPTTIYYAFKQSEIETEGISSTGWATFLQAVIDSGYVVVGTWPIRTEMANRMIALGTNALANSVVLVCRKRSTTAETLGRSEFIRALKRELPQSIEALLKVNIAPADMPQSAIGPGMAIFSQCKAVLEADDSPMLVKSALQLINRELDEYLSGIQGEFDAETRFTLTWFEQYGMESGEYGVANSIAMARGISVESVKHAGIIEASGGKVRILQRDEIDQIWDPTTDSHLTVWVCSQHMVRVLEHEGERGAALLLKNIGPERADAIRDLAYCIYDIAANKRQDASEAVSWNSLIKVWSELTRQAAAIYDTRSDQQVALDF